MDLFPTLCDFLGLPVPASVDGQSRRALIEGDEQAGASWSYGVYMDAMASITDGRHKLIRTYTRSDGRGGDRVQLFDLTTDPHELKDLSLDPVHTPLRRELDTRLLAHQQKLGDPLAAFPAYHLET